MWVAGGSHASNIQPPVVSFRAAGSRERSSSSPTHDRDLDQLELSFPPSVTSQHQQQQASVPESGSGVGFDYGVSLGALSSGGLELDVRQPGRGGDRGKNEGERRESTPSSDADSDLQPHSDKPPDPRLSPQSAAKRGDYLASKSFSYDELSLADTETPAIRDRSAITQSLSLEQLNSQRITIPNTLRDGALQNERRKRRSMPHVKITLPTREKLLQLATDAISACPKACDSHLLYFVAFAGVLFILPLPSFLKGFLLGLGVSMCVLWLVLLKAFPKVPETGVEAPSTHTQHLYQSLPSGDEPDQKEDSLLRLEVFVNEFEGSYDPRTHRMSVLRSVYLVLNGTSLRLFRPAKSLPKKATYAQRLSPEQLLFLSFRMYDLMGARVSLEPSGLGGNKLWLRKYPIRLHITLPGKRSLCSTDTDGTDSLDGVDEDENVKDCPPTTLFLFARTSRQKEDLFLRLSAATGAIDKFQRGHKRVFSLAEPWELDTEVRVSGKRPSHHVVTVEDPLCKYHLQYHTFIHAQLARATQLALARRDSASFIQLSTGSNSGSVVNGDGEGESVPGKGEAALASEVLGGAVTGEAGVLTGVNLFLSRVLWDVVRQPQWIQLVASKIQSKLATIKVPYFVDAITLTGLELGSGGSTGAAVPQITAVRDTRVNDQGVWASVDFVLETGSASGSGSGSGGIALTVDTRVDVQKLVEVETSLVQPDTSQQRKDSRSSGHEGANGATVTDSADHTSGSTHIPSWREALGSDGVEDSGESSEDDDSSSSAPSHFDHSLLLSSTNSSPNSGSGSGSGSGNGLQPSQRVRSALDRLAKSSTVQKLKERPFVKSLLSDLSQKHILLTITLHRAQGTLLLNIPPPPTDRLWWGFEETTEIGVTVTPRVGDKTIRIKSLCELIGQRLVEELKKVLFLPNMDDLALAPILTPFKPTHQNQTPEVPLSNTSSS